jgi:23S rRNA (guanosine2251-2'-O)-methyltransferase
MAKNYEVLYGRNSVRERLIANPGSVRKIFMRNNLVLGDIEKLINDNGVSLEKLPAAELDKMRPAKDLQGILARVEKYSYFPFKEILKDPGGKDETIIFLDRINDPHNLGTILRIAACFGKFSVVIPKHNACEVNETVIHVASGAENYIKVSQVSNTIDAMIKAKDAGYWIAGAVVDEDAEDISGFELPFPLGIVMGSEGAGIRPGVTKHLDMKIRIPMSGAKLSFNVSAACSIMCYEIFKQRGRK